MNLTLKKPYLLYLGDAADSDEIKTAKGILHFAREDCLAEFRHKNCKTTLNLPHFQINNVEQKQELKSMVLGLANAGGYIKEEWLEDILTAIRSGLNIISGLHQKLSSFPILVSEAEKYKVNLIDLRTHPVDLHLDSPRKRSGKRILTVGTDCNIGKMYTAIKLTNIMKQANFNANFVATGQTGILISGSGIAIDAVISDFLAAAIAKISPENLENHYDIIEGQASIFHPLYSGVSLGLLHASQPDYLVLCHEPTRKYMRHTEQLIPELKKFTSLHLELAKIVNPKAKFLAISLNLSKVKEEEAKLEFKRKFSDELNLPCFDISTDNMDMILNDIN